MELVERDKPLHNLEQRLQDAQGGSGKVVLLTVDNTTGRSNVFASRATDTMLSTSS